MHKISAAAFTLALSQQAFSGEPATIDWRRTVADIRAEVPANPLDASDKRLTYEVELRGEKYHLEYLFGEQGTLVNILYYKSFPAKGDDCLQEYERIRNDYKSELGAPEAETNVNAHLTAGHDCEAVARGELTASSEWTVHSTSKMTVKLSVWKGQPYVGVSTIPGDSGDD